MNIKTAIERLDSLRRRERELGEFLEHAHSDETCRGRATFKISNQFGQKQMETTTELSIADVIIPQIEGEITNVRREIEKITPVIDAANMQLKGIFS